MSLHYAYYPVDILRFPSIIIQMLYHYQQAFLREASRFTITLKARQVGFSYAFAARALHYAIYSPPYTALFLSLNQRDAEEKIRYARLLFYNLPKEVRRSIRLVRDSLQEIAFSNGSRLLSLPCSAGLRGRSGHLYLDEFAHFREDEEIFTAALPLASRGYEVHIASTPLGARGLFYEIFTNEEKYPLYKRKKIPWWYCPVFCKDIVEARLNAEKMTTEERVEKFGTPELKEIFRSFPTIEGFQQEYECAFLSDVGSFFPYDVIINSILDDMPPADMTKGYFYLGVDIGRTRDATAIALVYQPFQGFCHLVNLEINFKMPFNEAFRRIEDLIRIYKPLKVYIDRTGMGMPLAEELGRRWGNLIEGIHFTQQNKEAMMTNLRGLMERGQLKIPRNSELILQLHAIERDKYSAKGHDDAAWALALACAGIRAGGEWKIETAKSIFEIQ